MSVVPYTPSPPCAGCIWKDCGMRHYPAEQAYRCDRTDCLVGRVSKVLAAGGPPPSVDTESGEIIE